MGFLPKIANRKTTAVTREANEQRKLIRFEAKIGGELFGPVAAGHRRDFFCLDEHTWVWHEEWVEQGVRKATTTRYDVRPNTILKSQIGQPYQPVSKAEARNLYRAAQLYRDRVSTAYQQMLQAV